MNPIVSVIIPVYNGEKYIKKAIDSALSQDLPLEIIVINDCSTDKTLDILTSYGNKIIIINNKTNKKVSYSRNIGVKNAKGKYIAFLDSDDWWDQSKLKKQVKLLEEKNGIISSTARYICKDNGKNTNKKICCPREITYKSLLRSNYINCSSVLVRRDIMLKFPMEMDSAHEDYITWLKILKEAKICYGINEPLLFYRLSPKGKSRNKLKSAKMTFMVYRHLGFGIIKSSYYFANYMVFGILKYLGFKI